MPAPADARVRPLRVGTVMTCSWNASSGREQQRRSVGVAQPQRARRRWAGRGAGTTVEVLAGLGRQPELGVLVPEGPHAGRPRPAARVRAGRSGCRCATSANPPAVAADRSRGGLESQQRPSSRRRLRPIGRSTPCAGADASPWPEPVGPGRPVPMRQPSPRRRGRPDVHVPVGGWAAVGSSGAILSRPRRRRADRRYRPPIVRHPSASSPTSSHDPTRRSCRRGRSGCAVLRWLGTVVTGRRARPARWSSGRCGRVARRSTVARRRGRRRRIAAVAVRAIAAPGVGPRSPARRRRRVATLAVFPRVDGSAGPGRGRSPTADRSSRRPTAPACIVVVNAARARAARRTSSTRSRTGSAGRGDPLRRGAATTSTRCWRQAAGAARSLGVVGGDGTVNVAARVAARRRRPAGRLPRRHAEPLRPRPRPRPVDATDRGGPRRPGRGHRRRRHRRPAVREQRQHRAATPSWSTSANGSSAASASGRRWSSRWSGCCAGASASTSRIDGERRRVWMVFFGNGALRTGRLRSVDATRPGRRPARRPPDRRRPARAREPGSIGGPAARRARPGAGSTSDALRPTRSRVCVSRRRCHPPRRRRRDVRRPGRVRGRASGRPRCWCTSPRPTPVRLMHGADVEIPIDNRCQPPTIGSRVGADATPRPTRRPRSGPSGRKVTPQRERIFRILHDNPTHPTAEAVHAAVVADMPIGEPASTVYSTLHELAEMGELRQLDLGTGSARFDPNVDDHHHLVCDRCGAVAGPRRRLPRRRPRRTTTGPASWSTPPRSSSAAAAHRCAGRDRPDPPNRANHDQQGATPHG